jgi:hypothetical protein
MRVFSAGLWSLFHALHEAGPLKGPRTRWTRIPRYLEHRQLEPSSALKVIVWGNLVWGNANFEECFIALHMISVRYPLENSSE